MIALAAGLASAALALAPLAYPDTMPIAFALVAFVASICLGVLAASLAFSQ